MTITLDGSSLTVEKLVRIAREGEQVELDPAALERIKVCRAMLEEKIAAREIMYGTNTGIGEFSEIVLDDDQVQQFQRYLVYNHAAGIGEPAPIEVVRAAMAARVNVHAHGNSGNRPEITQTLVALLNKGVTPVMSSKGSVGACGDLAPMAQMALVMMGEGDSFYQGERMPSREALERAGIPVPGLEARDGLATINGSNVLTGMSALLCYDADRWLRQAEIAASMSLEALLANLKPYNSKLHELRGFSGAVRSAAAIRACIQESDLATGKIKTKVQDAYSMRSTPQVIGAAHDALKWAKSQVEIELNGVGDNPIFVPEDKLTLTGANFQGTPVSLPMEMVGQAITMVSVLSERRLNRLENTGDEPGPARLPDAQPRLLQRPDAQPVHRRHAHHRAAHPVGAGEHDEHPRRGGPGGLRLHGHEHRPQEPPDPRERLRRARHRVHGRGAGARLPRLHAGQGRARRQGRDPQARRPPRHRPAAVPGPQRDGRPGRVGRDPRRGRGRGRPAGLTSGTSMPAGRGSGGAPAKAAVRPLGSPPSPFSYPLPVRRDRLAPANGGPMDDPAVRAQLDAADITVGPLHRNLPAPELIARSLARGEGIFAANGALVVTTGERTGRSPADRYIVDEPGAEDVDWGASNQPCTPEFFDRQVRRVSDYLRRREVYVFDGFIGAEPTYRTPIRVVTRASWHGLFAHTLFVRPEPIDLEDFEPAFTVIDCGELPVDARPEAAGTATPAAATGRRRPSSASP